MNIQNLSDQNLIQKTQRLVQEEREVLTHVLHHLKEIQRRRLFSSLGYKSLFDFTVKRLGYSEDQAYRRISAMKLLKEIPELELKIQSGDITLTHLNLAQSHFRQEEKVLKKEISSEEKLQVLELIQNKSVREAEKITLSLSSGPSFARKDQVKLVSGNHVEIRFIASEAVQAKISKVKNLLAHRQSEISMGELFEKLCDLGLDVWDPSKKPAKKVTKNKITDLSEVKIPKYLNIENRANFAAPRKRRVKAKVRRQVFSKAQNQCENCGSEYALEIDHIIPHAKGGPSDLENLRVLCKSCNQRSAIQEFGINRMEQYLN